MSQPKLKQVVAEGSAQYNQLESDHNSGSRNSNKVIPVLNLPEDEQRNPQSAAPSGLKGLGNLDATSFYDDEFESFEESFEEEIEEQ